MVLVVGVVAALAVASPARATTVPPTDPAATVPASPTTIIDASIQVPPTTIVDASIPVPQQVPPPIGETGLVEGPLVVVPAGCLTAPPPQAVFLGTLVNNDATTGRFQVTQLRSGSLDGFAVGDIVDVRYGDEVRFLKLNTQYLVGAAVDSDLGRLSSKVRQPSPLFGGDAVLGVNDSDVACPAVEDAVSTLYANGLPVDSGVLRPLHGSSKRLLRAILLPLGVATAVLVGLVLIKHLLFGLGRAVRSAGQDDDETIRRSKFHQPGDPDASPDDDLVSAGGAGQGT